LIKKAALSVADVLTPVSLKCNEQFWNLLGLLPGVYHGQLKSAPLACKKTAILKPHENHEQKNGLHGTGLPHQDTAVFQ